MHSGENIYYTLASDNKCNRLKTGLNIIDESDPMYFNYTNKSNLLHNLYYTKEQNWLRIAIIPNKEQQKLPTTIRYGTTTWKTKKIILSKPYPLYDLETIKKFNLEITDRYINNACGLNKIDILEWWKNMGLDIKYNYNGGVLFDTASVNGHLDVLEWLLKNEFSVKCLTRWTINDVSRNGHVNVLEWWFKHGSLLTYDEEALDYASGEGHIDVLKSWKNSGLELKYSENALDFASGEGRVNVLIWWFESGLPLKYSENALFNACVNGHINVLEWWLNSGLTLKYSENALFNAYDNGYINLQEWWLNSGLTFKYTEKTLDSTTTANDLNVLNWCENSGLLSNYSALLSNYP